MARSTLIPTLLALSLLSLTGCQRNASDQSAMQQQSIRIKPHVAIIPVIDNTQSSYAWSLSEEFTTSVFSYLDRDHLLALDDMNRVQSLAKKCKENPFGKNFSWIKRSFPQEQFVVFLELVQHEEVFRKSSKEEEELAESAADLNMSMRIRVFDLRGKEPKVVLQDIVEEQHFIPRQFTHINFHQVPWGDEHFHFSPLGLAHVHFAHEIGTRIQDYILLALHKDSTAR